MGRIFKIILLTASIWTISFFAPCVRAEVTLTTLVTFDGTNGYLPQAGLVQGKDGNFYGTLLRARPIPEEAVILLCNAGRTIKENGPANNMIGIALSQYLEVDSCFRMRSLPF